MTKIKHWQETESQVYTPHRGILLAIGLVFMTFGIVAFLAASKFVPEGRPLLFARLGTAVFAALGGFPFLWSIVTIIRPATISHAADDVLADVPDEPVVWEGTVVHGRLTHELVDDARRWEFQPARRLRRSANFMLYGFGVPFMIVFAGIVSWTFNEKMGFDNWFLSIALSVAATLLSGGTALLVIGLIMRSGYRQLSSLSIPKNGDPLELDMPVVVEPKDINGKKDIIKGLKWLTQEGIKRQKVEIPRDWVCAVQLCPWKYEFSSQGQSSYWAVEGLLVLRSPEETSYVRLPIMLTGYYVGAARLMRELAQVLGVPYLFHADDEGWKAEVERARTRPPMQSGGWLG